MAVIIGMRKEVEHSEQQAPGSCFVPRTTEEVDVYLENIKRRKDPPLLRDSQIEKALVGKRKIRKISENLLELFQIVIFNAPPTNRVDITNIQFPVPYGGHDTTANDQPIPQLGTIRFHYDGKRVLHVTYHRGYPDGGTQIDILGGGLDDLTYLELVTLWKSRAQIFSELCFIHPMLRPALEDLFAVADQL
jgi:hypothetical protein